MHIENVSCLLNDDDVDDVTFFFLLIVSIEILIRIFFPIYVMKSIVCTLGSNHHKIFIISSNHSHSVRNSIFQCDSIDLLRNNTHTSMCTYGWLCTLLNFYVIGDDERYTFSAQLKYYLEIPLSDWKTQFTVFIPCQIDCGCVFFDVGV